MLNMLLTPNTVTHFESQGYDFLSGYNFPAGLHAGYSAGEWAEHQEDRLLVILAQPFD